MADEELKSLLLAQSIEIRRHFDVSVERMEARFALLAEAIAQVDQKVVRAVDRIDETIERTAAETQAMVKFSLNAPTVSRGAAALWSAAALPPL